MKIRSLSLKNIGVFEDETIAFPENKEKGMAEIHILTGQNGTGKTTILQALASGFAEDKLLPQKLLKNLEKRFKSKSYNHIGINFNKWKYSHRTCTDSQYFKEFIADSEEDKKNEFIKNGTLKEAFERLVAFAYSGYRFIEHEENINIKEKENYNPLENALEFNKTYGANDYTLNQWLANKMAKRNSAFFEGKKEDVEKFSKSIEYIKQIIKEIIGLPIDFKFETDKSKIVVAKEGIELDLDLLPDGLRSIISWIGDLIMRMDALKWKDDLPIFEREFILFLDEIEVHLHPSWQRKILPVVQKLFKNAQIFITTHSPFIVNSIDGAFIYELDLDENGHSKVTEITISDSSKSYQNVIREVFEVSRFSEPLEKELKEFTDTRNDILLHKNIDEKAFLNKAYQLASRNDEVKNTILFELRQLSKKTGKEYAL